MDPITATKAALLVGEVALIMATLNLVFDTLLKCVPRPARPKESRGDPRPRLPS